MKRILRHLRPIASPSLAAALLALLLAFPAAASFCNNATPPCSTSDPKSGCYTPPPPPPTCEETECKCTRSPCYVGSGAYEWSAQDLSIETTGFPIDVRRLYRSTQAIDGQSGHGWVSSLSARLYYTVYLKAAPSTYQKEVNVRLTNGVLYRFVENANGSYTAPEGRFDTLVRNGDGSWDFSVQRSMSRYHFAANGNLLTAVDDYGNTQTWTYVNDRISRIEDSSGSGRYIDVTHGADGRISDVTDLTGRNVHYTYNSSGVMTSVANAAGQTTAYSYTTGKYAPLLSAITDHWGRNITTVTYDAQDRVTSYTDKGETYSYTYNYNGNTTQTSKRDSSNNTWVYTFGQDGLVLADAFPGGGTGAAETYYPNGLIDTETDPVGVKTKFTYNARGNPLTVIADYQGATAIEWRYTYDPNFPDRPLSYKPYTPGTNQIHPDWQGAQFEYYQAGSPAPGAMYRTYALANDGVTARVMRTFTYDSHGRLLTSTDALGHVLELTYDAAGNLATSMTAANNDAGTHPVKTYAYDALGRMTSVTDPTGHVTTYAWDALDRLITQTLPKPTPSSPLTFSSTAFYDEYDSATQLLFTRFVDENGRTTKSGTDQYGQLIQTVDQAGNIRRAVYTKGLHVSLADPNNNLTTYAYDARHRLTTTTFPDGTTELLTYYADDLVASRRDRSNQTVNYAYDRHKRRISRTYPNGGAITRTFAGQKLTQVVDTFASPSETHTYAYDNWFRIITNVQGPRGTITRTYLANDWVATYAVSGGATATYGYYPDGNVRTIDWSVVTGSFKYDYNLRGQIASITFPNGQTRTSSYDDQGRLTQIANVHPTTGTLATFAYGYDVDPFSGQPTQLGQRTVVTATVPALSLAGAATQFTYDTRYQLIQAAYPAGTAYNALAQSWTYDALGNRLTATENGTTTSYAYINKSGNPLDSDRLSSDGANTYTYDARGNTTARTGSRGNYTFTWDYENRLRSVNGDETAGYLFDWLSRRSLKTVSGVSTSYVYNFRHAVAETGAAPAEYLFGPGMDDALAMWRGGQVYYYAIDALGSVVTLNDSAGAVQNSYAWDAFGTARARTENVVNPIVYTAREAAEAGLLHYRYRQYEPAAGRFTSEDPWRWKDELGNLYRYVANRPTMLVDPSGRGYKPMPFYNCDNIPYTAMGETGDDREQHEITIPARDEPNRKDPMPPDCKQVPPDWDVDFVCTNRGWRKVVTPGAKIQRGSISPFTLPPWDWPQPFPCPRPKCPPPAPPPSGGPPPGGPPRGGPPPPSAPNG